MRADSDQYKVLMQKENDKFRMEEGLEAEYVTQLIKANQEAMMRYFQDAIREQRAKSAVPSPLPAQMPEQPHDEEEEDWDDVDEDGQVSKTVELA